MRKIIEYLRFYFILGGMSPEEYSVILPEVRRENQKIAKATAMIMVVVFGYLFIFSYISEGLSDYRIMYGLGLVLSMLEFVIFKFWINEKSRALEPLMYIQNSVLYLLGIFVSTCLSPGSAAVSFCVMQVGIPLFPIHKPVRKAGMLLWVTALFIICVRIFKPADLAYEDTINGLIYYFVSIVANTYLACFRLASIRMRGVIERERDTDLLTGLCSKKALMSRIDSYLASGGSGIFIVVDVDDFKHFNDTYGHDTGDFVIHKVGEYIEADFRKSDIKGRFGGDEFVVFMKDATDIEAAVRRAKTLQNHIANCIELPVDGDRVHVSMGIALWEESDRSYGKMLIKADKALYKAKESGKNQFAVYNKTMC